MEFYRFLKWHYDDAMAWMNNAREEVYQGGACRIAFGEHTPAVVTLGRHADEKQILNPSYYEKTGTLIRRIERGGGATWHGLGQLVVYPVISLEKLGLTVGEFTCLLQKVTVQSLTHFDIESHCNAVSPGVYVGEKKIASIGFHVSRGVVTHGLAINVCNNLEGFSNMTPCGVSGLITTSVAQETGRMVSVADFATVVEKNCIIAFG